MFWNKKLIELERENAILNSRIAVYEQELISKNNPLVLYRMDDPSPDDSEERYGYLAKVVGFFTDVFENKLKHMVSQQQSELSNPANSDKVDMLHKGTINSLSLLLDWGDECKNEMMSKAKNDEDNINNLDK